MSRGIRVRTGTYVDSVMQLAGTRAMLVQPRVEWAAAAMATPANLDTLHGQGFTGDALSTADANDLVLAVRAKDPHAVDAALTAGDEAMFAAQTSAPEEQEPIRTLERAVELQPDNSVAVISVPGEYAAMQAHKALTAGLDVLLFSDNVSVQEEIALKDRAAALGKLVMGPGAGTALLNGTGLGFANAVRPGQVGVVAAAGTGAQEVMCLLDHWGAGVSSVIGLGGRDLSEAVDGRMARQAIGRLRADPGTDVIVLVSKPPAPHVARAVISAAGDHPLVAVLVGLRDSLDVPPNVRIARTLEEGALATVDLLGLPKPLLSTPTGSAAPGRTAIRGLFSGGTLCYESQVILADTHGPVYSNAPLDKSLSLPYPPGASACLDLGEEEYTKGRPPPMIDPEARLEMLRSQAADPTVAVILLDIVLGYGSHPNPASALAPTCADITGPQIIAYCLGTNADPQNLQSHRQLLRDAGCIVTETAARASFAAAICAGQSA